MARVNKDLSVILNKTDLLAISNNLKNILSTFGLLGVIMQEAAESDDQETSEAAGAILLEIHGAVNIGLRGIYEVLEIDTPLELGAVH